MQSSAPLLEQAIQKHRQGDLAAAAALYKQVIQLEPHPKALGLLGLIEHDMGRSDVGIELLRQSVQADPTDAGMQVNLGTVLAESGRDADALTCFMKAAEQDPDNISALENIILHLGKQNRIEESAPFIERAARLQPQSEVAQFRLFMVWVAGGEHEKAYALMTAAPLKSARRPGLSYHKSIVCLANGKPGEAMEHAKQAVAESPSSPEAALLLAHACYSEGKLADAIEHYKKAIELGISPAETGSYLSHALLQSGNHAEAEAMLSQLARGDDAAPMDDGARSALAVSYWRAGDDTGARRVLTASPSSSTDTHQRVALALMIPQIMESVDSIRAERERYRTHLAALLADPPQLNLPHNLIGTSNFYLAFHGEDNKALQIDFSKFCRAADPSLNFIAPHCEKAQRKPGPTRVGFLTRFIMDHSVSLCFSRIVEAVSKVEDMQTFLISSSRFDEPGAQRNYAAFNGTTVQIRDGALQEARQTIADLELDILVYMDIGMDLDSHLLAHARLARTQCVLGGHPDTTGIDTIDLHFSSALAEAPEADAHYSEKLVRLPLGLFYFHRPVLPQSMFGFQKGRTQLGLPASGRIYLCPASPQKLHPEFDGLLNGILARDDDAHIILFKNPQIEGWNTRISARLDRSIEPARRNRIHMLPWIQQPLDFANVVALSDVVLEPLHFGLGSTAAITNFVGTPTVALPRQFLRGRTGLFYSKLLGLPECLAQDANDYVERAIEIARNKDLRRQLSGRIKSGNGVLYGNMQPVQDFVAYLRGI